MTGPTGDLARDTATLQGCFDRGVRPPPGRWAFLAPLLYPLRGARIDLEGVELVYAGCQPGWTSGWAICSRGYVLHGRPRAVDAVIDFGRTGRITIRKADEAAMRAGICINETDGAIVRNARIISGPKAGARDRLGWALNIHNSNDVLVSGGLLNVESEVEGADGLHVTGTCRRVRVERLSTRSGDDGTSLTHEMGHLQQSVIEDVTFVDCSIDNLHHSAIKGWIAAGMGAGSTIRRVTYLRCDLKTTLRADGQGAAVRIDNEGDGIVEDVSIIGGRLRHIVPVGGKTSDPLIFLRGVDRFTLRDTAIDYFGRVLVQATNCRDLRFRPSRTSLSAAVGRMSSPRPLVDLTACDGHDIPLMDLKASWPGQELLRNAVL